MRLRSLTLGCLGTLVGVIMLPAQAAGPLRDGLKIGLVKTMFHNVTIPQFQVMAATFQTVMETQTGFKGQLVPGGSPDEIRQQLADGSIHLGVLHGIEFGWMKQKQPELEPMMLNHLDPDLMRAVVVVGKDHAAKSLSDCRGQKLALLRITREDTRLYLARLCQQNDSSVSEMFPEYAMPDSVEGTLDELVDGRLNVVVLELAGLKMYQRRKPGRAANLRVLQQSERFPSSVIAFRKDKIDATTIKSFRDGMSTAHTSILGGHLMSLMKVRKFEVPTEEYAKQLTDALKLYPMDRMETLSAAEFAPKSETNRRQR